MHTKHNPIIELNNVCFSYPGGARVLDNLHFELHENEKVGLKGRNGSGKTTFFHIIMGLLRPSEGAVRVSGKTIETEKDFRFARQKIGLLFQDPDDQLFCPTVIEDVAFGPLNLGRSPEEAKDISIRVLDQVGLKGFEHRVTHALSGGEKRLVSLATILSMEPQVLLLDEPSNGLDESAKEHVAELLSELDVALICVSHDKDFLQSITHRTVAMEHGRTRSIE